jgi:hypothetical protein
MDRNVFKPVQPLHIIFPDYSDYFSRKMKKILLPGVKENRLRQKYGGT